MTEAIIKTSFGEIRIIYTTTEELGEALRGLEQQINMVSEMACKIAPAPPKVAKVGYENAYRFLPDGGVQLLYFPHALVHLVALALYAYDPDTVTAAVLEKVTGIVDVADKVLWQKKNKKYFRKANRTFGLTRDGLDLVSKKVKPLIDKATESKQK